MNRRLAVVVLALTGLLIGCFARLVADPSALIVDADHPSVDHARPHNDASVGNDLTRLFLPHHLAIARTIARVGHLPQWDDRGFGGRPLVGNPQAGLFYPPAWLAWWSGAASSLGWITVGHLLFSGLGAYRLARTLGMSGWGSLVAAGCVQASPYVLAQTFEGHYPHVWAVCWYPWAFNAAIRLRQGERKAIPALAFIIAASFLAGHPQETYYLMIALGGWAVIDGMAAIRAGRGREALGLWASWIGVLVLGVGLMGIELVPDALAQGWVVRVARLPLRVASRYHIYPINILQLLNPRALGGPADYFGHENYWESVTSIGLIPLSLALIALAWSPHRRVVRGWLILVAASLLFASGRKLGLFALLYHVVPGMDRFRVPARSLYLASLGASMLAGLGVDALRERFVETERWQRLARKSCWVTIAIALAILSARWLADTSDSASKALDLPTVTLRDRATGIRPHSQATEFDRLLRGFSRLSADPTFWLALGVLPLGLTLGWKRPTSRQAIAAALGILGLVELGFLGHALIRVTPAEEMIGPDPISAALLQSRPTGPDSFRIRAVDALYDDLRAGQVGLSKTNVNDSFQIQHGADLYEPLYHLFDEDLFDRGSLLDQAIALYRREIRQAVLDRMAVSRLVSDHLEPAAPWTLLKSGTWKGLSFAMYENPTALPRAYVVSRAEVTQDDRFTVGRFRHVDPRQAVLLPTDPLGPELTARQPFTPAEWSSTDPDRILLKVTTQAPGLLVVADTWMPGWSAIVDGKSVPVLRGNRAQRVVPLLEPGSHEVILRYRTPGLQLGLAFTITSALLGIAWLIAWNISNRRGKSPVSDFCH